MKKILCASAFSLLSGQMALAASIAVIDSGVDYKHKDLVGKIWNNSDEIASNNKDDDSNKYADDMMGWNFAEKNNQVIDYKYLSSITADALKFYEVQGRIVKGTATQEDKDYYAAKKADKEFLKKLNIFGNFVHGTHVSGIAAVDAKHEVMAVKLIPTEPPAVPGLNFQKMGQFAMLVKRQASTAEVAGNPLVEILLGFLAGQQSKPLVAVGEYVNFEKIQVANGSFGVSVNAVKPLLAQLIQQFTGAAPTAEELEQYAISFVNKIVDGMKDFVAAAPNTLFVFAAGNDGTDNDKLPASPANVKADNSISVAATLDVTSLASFSNFGAKMVEVAAPGVTIESSIPGDKRIAMSGTSMAAPFVTNVASRVINANPKLKPAEVKAILIKTVDSKAFLAGKVASGGIVNSERAVMAAELSVSMDLNAAIQAANSIVEDVQSDRELADEVDAFALPLQMPWF